jgi:hypothetical protein
MRRWIAVIIAVLALVIATDVVAWQILTTRMRASWDGFVARQRAMGWQVAAAVPVAEGFPLAARLRIEGVEISHDSKPIAFGISAGAETLLLEVPFFLPTHIAYKPQGALHLRVGRGPDITFTADDLALRAALRARAFSLDGVSIQAVTPLGVVVVGGVHAQLTLHNAQEVQGGELALVFDRISVPPETSIALMSPTIDQFALDLSLETTILTLRSVSLDWGKLNMTGQGNIEPDGKGQPAGDLKLHISGASDALDSLVLAGQIAQRDANNVKMVLGLLQRTGPDGRVLVELPLKLTDRLLTIGGFPVMRVPEVHLPALQSVQ